jgi:hypothetical protein
MNKNKMGSHRGPSPEMFDVDKPYNFLCAAGHEFVETPANVYAGWWCPECYPPCGWSGVAGDNERKVKEIVKKQKVERGYVVECEKGHIFLMTGEAILNGQWCPQCKKVKK